MDYIHGLLIMEDDNDSEHETDDGDDTPLGSGSEQTVVATLPSSGPRASFFLNSPLTLVQMQSMCNHASGNREQMLRSEKVCNQLLKIYKTVC